MSIRISCACGKSVQVKDEMEGKRVRCPACQQPVLVPNVSSDAEEEIEMPAKSAKVQRPRYSHEVDDSGEEKQPNLDRRKRKKAQRGQRKSNKALWIGLGSSVAAILLVAVVVTVLMIRRGKKALKQEDDNRPDSAPAMQAGGQAPFLDQEKEVPPRVEWNREVASRRGGPFTFRVTSQGPFAVTVITAEGFKMFQRGGRPQKGAILLTVDSKELTLERSVTAPPGSLYIIIANQSDRNVRIHLQCFEGDKK